MSPSKKMEYTKPVAKMDADLDFYHTSTFKSPLKQYVQEIRKINVF